MLVVTKKCQFASRCAGLALFALFFRPCSALCFQEGGSRRVLQTVLCESVFVLSLCGWTFSLRVLRSFVDTGTPRAVSGHRQVCPAKSRRLKTFYRTDRHPFNGREKQGEAGESAFRRTDTHTLPKNRLMT